MLEKIISVYVFLLGRVRFHRFNRFLFRLSLAGLGVLNYKTAKVSGERAFLEGYFRNRGGVLIDVGANQGDYSLAALGVNEKISVYAFEPHPLTYSSLVRNVSGHSSIVPVNKGLSAAKGVLELYDYPDKDGSQHATLFKEVITEIHGAGAAVAHEVSLITLDEFISGEELDEVSLLKIDTEGNELEVLRGGVNSLAERKIKAIHLEFNEMNVASRVFFRDFWKILKDYRIYRLLPNEMLEIKRYDSLNCEIFAYQNIVAILKE